MQNPIAASETTSGYKTIERLFDAIGEIAPFLDSVLVIRFGWSFCIYIVNRQTATDACKTGAPSRFYSAGCDDPELDV
jgi:hypothetical protein